MILQLFKNRLVVIGFLWGLSILIILLLVRFNDSSQKEIERLENNNKALVSEKDSLKTEGIVYRLKIQEITLYKDSVLSELDSVSKELKISKKKIRQMMRLSHTAKKTDTITLNDTIFKDPDFRIDTTVGDKWYKLDLTMAYPDSVFITPEFKSKKSIIFSTRRETIKPPSKIFFIRWFQKRHTVLEWKIVEESPYITEDNNKFIEIIK